MSRGGWLFSLPLAPLPLLHVQVHTEEEIAKIGVPVTFRAACTSLSGQAITDSVLLKLSHTGRNFRNFEIHVRAPRPSSAIPFSAMPAPRLRLPC